MIPADRIADAFAGGRADPNQSIEELERFYQQAKWLAECADYIYPPHVDRSDDARMKEWKTIWTSFSEQHSDAMKKSPDAKADREKWEIAVNAFALQLQDSSTTSPARTAYVGLDENALDAISDRLQSDRRKLFPTFKPWKLLFPVSEPMRLATQNYELAHRLWTTRAETRIREYIVDNWAAEASSVGGTSGGEIKVEFKSKHGIEYFLASNDNLVILCFRGTEVHKLSDIITDMRAWQVEIPEKKRKAIADDAKALSSQSASPKTKTKSVAPKFHEGFWSALNGVWEQIAQNPVWKVSKKQVWITGHSLGGALATLAAYRLVRDEVISADQINGVFTFGQPRVGDVQFAGGYSGTRDRHYRFVHNCDIVTMIPPKSIRWLFRAGSIFLKQGPAKQKAGALAAVSKVAQTDSEILRKSYDYADVGNILFLNRANRVKLLKPKFWLPFDLFFGRVGSLLRSPFVDTKYRSWVERFVPGVADHSMQEYSRVLKIACAHCAFLKEAVARMREPPELQKRKESELIKTAEQAWKRLRAGADPLAWGARKKVESSLAKMNDDMEKLRKDLNDLTKDKQRGDMTKEEKSKKDRLEEDIDKLRTKLCRCNADKAVVWLETWHDEISKTREQALARFGSSSRSIKTNTIQ